MIYVRCKNDLKDAYIYLRFMESDSNGFANQDAAKDLIKELKHDIRDYYKRKEIAMNNGHRIVSQGDNWDYIEVVELPEEISDEESAVEYFDEYERLYYRPSPYDCTGQHFTRWVKLFTRNGRWMAYHSVGCDV